MNEWLFNEATHNREKLIRIANTVLVLSSFSVRASNIFRSAVALVSTTFPFSPHFISVKDVMNGWLFNESTHNQGKYVRNNTHIRTAIIQFMVSSSTTLRSLILKRIGMIIETVHLSFVRASNIFRSAVVSAFSASVLDHIFISVKTASASLSASLSTARTLSLTRIGTPVARALTNAARTLTLTRFSTEEITDTTTLEAETNDIYELHGKDLSYPTARTVLYETKNVEYSTCGQHYYNYYNVYRTALLFNLNSIGGYEILSATLKLTGYNDWSSDRDFNMQARGFTEDTLASNNASFIGYGNTSFGSINTLDYSGNADGMTISFNSSGLSYLTNKISSDCVIMLISDDDINAIAPSSAYENLGIYSAGASTPAYRPHLEITYRGVPPLKMAVSAAATKFATIFKIAATDVITGASTVFWRTVVIMENVGIAVSSTGSRALTLARTASAGVAAAISTGWTYGIYLLVRLGIYDYAHSRPAILRSNVFVKAVTTAYHKMISKIFRGNI